jgi:hypothetical protein
MRNAFQTAMGTRSAILPAIRPTHGNVSRLNYPIVPIGGAREEWEAAGEAGCDSTRGSRIAMTMEPKAFGGVETTGSLCDVIWQDQAQREECADSLA